MATSLQDQLLKAGLVDSKKASQVKKAKKKQARQQFKSNEQTVDETKQQAQQALKEKAERDRELNRQREQEAQQKAIAAQIKQLIESNRLPKEGDIGFSFTDQSKVKKVYVTKKVQTQLERGIVSIVRLDEQYVIVPTPVAEKIEQRDASYLVLQNQKGAEQSEPNSDDEYYAQFEIPDDLMW